MTTALPLPTRQLSAQARGLPPMPWGWFVVGLSHELQPGEVRPLRYFERELVMFRTESGKAVVMDAHCPHLGADLGFGGTVEGESIRCPFHGWRFGDEGQCVEVPECDRIPPKARAKAWHSREQNGVIMAWYHPDGRDPTFEVGKLEDDGWTAPKTVVWRVRTHPQEVCENTVDTAHMRPVHSTEPSRVRGGPNLDGPKMSVDLAFVASGEIVGMEGDNDVELDIMMFGLGVIQVTSRILNAGLLARYRVCCTPVDSQTIDIYGLSGVRYGDDRAFTDEVSNLFFEAFTKDFIKDFPIWENKLYRGRPALSGADGPIGLYRRWARQFYAEAPTTTRGETRSNTRRNNRVANALVSARGLLSRVRTAVKRRRGEGETTTNLGSPTTAKPKPKPKPKKSQAPRMRVESAEHYRQTLANRFVPSAATGIDAVFQWELSGDGAATFHAVVRDGDIEIQDGPHPSPTVSLSMTADDYVKVVNGDLDGTKAFTSGRGKVSGKIRMAMKMRSIFPQ